MASGSYGRLLALLCRRTGDVCAAEDALSDAFARALTVWPERGVPEHPDAWLLSVARRRLIDLRRRGSIERRVLAGIAREVSRASRDVEAGVFTDERLLMLYTCADPRVEDSARLPLMLQAALGLEASRIASVLLVHPGALAQRLVRAKAKIRELGLAFEVPDRAEGAKRLGVVLSCVYAAYTIGWDALHESSGVSGLASDAVWLAEQIVEMSECSDRVESWAREGAEALALAALLNLSESRRGARRDAAGAYVPTSEQDTSMWDVDMIARGEAYLSRAAQAMSRGAPVGRFQIEAAIQSVHCARAWQGTTDIGALRVLHARLEEVAPTIGARCAHAAVVAEAGDPRAALAMLDAVEAADVAAHGPYWATRGAVLAGLGRMGEAGSALRRAAGLADDPAVRAWLLARACGT